jgi:hypothetical protein
MGEERFWWGNLMEGDNFEDIGVDGKTILKGYLSSGLGA